MRRFFQSATAVALSCLIILNVVPFVGMTGSATASGVAASNGVVQVYLSADGEEWTEAGQFGFVESLTEETLEVTGLSNPTYIRLVQVGGGASHIDEVLLDGQGPVAVVGGDALGIAKLAEADLDLFHVTDGQAELVFETGAATAVLKVTARIEPVELGKIPFQFPVDNQGKPFGAESSYYTYTLGLAEGTLDVDGSLDEVPAMVPVFQEFVRPASGHPDGLIYAWAMNDSENLYLALDTTPDNTLDTGEDYAKVYVKTPTGVKVFAVTGADSPWGIGGFTYTDKVGYQHKVYEFAIPLNEMGVSGDVDGQEVQLGFSAYGTMSAPADQQAVADDLAWLTYLLILADNTSALEVTSDLYLPTSGPNGTSISWESNNEDVISMTGDVTRPEAGEGEVTVILTATVSKGEYSGSDIFEITVLEEDPAPPSEPTWNPGYFQFTAPAYSVSEGAGKATIGVMRWGGAQGEFTINYSTSDGTALAGIDYGAVSGVLTFAEGETFKTFDIPIISDNLAEEDETVNIQMSSMSALFGTAPKAVLTIEDAPVTAHRVIELTIDSVIAKVDGEERLLDAPPRLDPEPERTLVPVRFIAEALGARVEWLEAERQVLINDGVTEMLLTIDSADVLVNGELEIIDCPARILEANRTYVPLRFVSETLGATVEYDHPTRGITITK